MRIKGPNHDYYDGAAGCFDTDPKRVWVRKTQETIYDWENKLPKELVPVKRFPPGLGDTERGSIGFCGKVYPYYVIGGKYCYTKNQVEKALIKKGKNPEAKAWLAKLRGEKKAKRWKRWGDGPLWLNYRDLTPATWEKRATVKETGDEPFIFADSPVVAIFKRYNGIYVVVNPLLKEFSFQRVMDPYTAYQELEMYVGSNLVKQMDPNVHVSDVIKAESHGFNKWSFRTPPKEK